MSDTVSVAFFPQLSNERLGLLTNTLTFFGAGAVGGPADDQGGEVDELPEGYGDDELLVVVGLAEQPGVFSVPGLDGVCSIPCPSPGGREMVEGGGCERDASGACVGCGGAREGGNVSRMRAARVGCERRVGRRGKS